jgi:hypothetical protein
MLGPQIDAMNVRAADKQQDLRIVRIKFVDGSLKIPTMTFLALSS